MGRTGDNGAISCDTGSVTHGRFERVEQDGGLSATARVLVALARVDRSTTLCLPDLYATAGVKQGPGWLALTVLKARGYLQANPGFGRRPDKEYRLTQKGEQMARMLDAKKPHSRR